VRLVGDDDNVVSLAVGLLLVHRLIELVNEREDEAVDLLENLLRAGVGSGRRSSCPPSRN
jgi:hypothetical protein